MGLVADLSKFDSLTKAGEYTFKAHPTNQNIHELKSVCNYMFEKVDTLSEITRNNGAES